MLSDINIFESLKNNEISISVSFYKNGNELCMYTQEMPLLQSGSATNLYSDRLKLTMGASHNSNKQTIGQEKVHIQKHK